MSSGIIEGRTIAGDLALTAEVVVVGSGAGGAVVAKELAEAGLDVVVLEEGPHVPESVYRNFRPTETLRHMGREAGTTAVFGIGDTPIIAVTAGRAIGGSSTLTGGVCFRVPEIIHQRWVEERGLDMLTSRDLEPSFLAVERESSVKEVPASMRSRSTTLLAEGAAKLGIAMKPLRRNTQDCVGYSRCNFGCPVGAKMSVDRTYLPKAIAAGARVYSDCLVEGITSRGGRATGVEGTLLGSASAAGQERRGRFVVRADTVVVACGTLHSALLLMRSGFNADALGRHLTLHPSFRVVANFDMPIEGWRGALQSVYSDTFEPEGITLVGLFVPPNMLAATLPGVGQSFALRVARLRHLAIFGGLVHDEDGGRVRPGIGREPLITYRLAKKDKAGMLKGIRLLAESFLAAGATEVYAPIFGMPPLRSAHEVHSLVTDDLPARKMESVSFHPLGACRMAKDAKDGVVDPWGRCFEMPNVLVADGSVFPTSIGVNSQLPIMAMAHRVATHLAADLTKTKAARTRADRAARESAAALR